MAILQALGFGAKLLPKIAGNSIARGLAVDAALTGAVAAPFAIPALHGYGDDITTRVYEKASTTGELAKTKFL